MNLGDVLIKEKEKQIKNKNCELCENKIDIKAATVKNNKHQTKGVYLCCKGLKFPKCRWLKNGFKNRYK